MRKSKLLTQDIILKILGIFFTILVIAIVLALIGTEIYVWVKYANTPINELPAWVIFFMFGHK